MTRKKKPKIHVGEIYFVSPKHLVKKKDWPKYAEAKATKTDNKRPVMVAVQKSNKKVQISEMTTTVTVKEKNRRQVVRLSNTYPEKNSHVSTSTIAKSRLTKKHFKAGDSPLTKKNKRRIHPLDLNEYNKTRKRNKKEKTTK